MAPKINPHDLPVVESSTTTIITSATQAHAWDKSIDFSNEALQAERTGNYALAAELHARALDLKIIGFGADTVATAISYNGLGGVLTRLGRLDEADEMLTKALAIRERQGPRFDLAITREYIGALREVQDRRKDAIEIRKKGAEGGKKEMCPGQMFALSELKTCGGCGAPNYCSVDCQKRDWKERHKVLCGKLKASIEKDT
ncbi:hypothetical protein HYFRA_00013343 [Hymenoscyphus fraxineus]|uniref:MYND-type domain-containing protein n=1 Tax=Hymenoscyphus fraxineus TaxID=746836 RepID=A0A9N9LBW6_9HELO|nr:hypothetical protein HYFRA_00013343 [Hymenoscyphus fraxineus]